MNEQKRRMLDGELYLAGDPELVAERQRCALLLEEFNNSSPTDGQQRVAILNRLLGSLGESTEIMPPFRCDYGYLIHIGSRTFINYGAVILDCAEVTIGDEVQIGPGAQLLAASHPLDPDTRRQGWEFCKPIQVEDGAWLGGGVIVFPGVQIGVNSVIGAGSVVTKDIPDGVLAYGNPCRVIRVLPTKEKRGN